MNNRTRPEWMTRCLEPIASELYTKRSKLKSDLHFAHTRVIMLLLSSLAIGYASIRQSYLMCREETRREPCALRLPFRYIHGSVGFSHHIPDLPLFRPLQ